MLGDFVNQYVHGNPKEPITVPKKDTQPVEVEGIGGGVDGVVVEDAALWGYLQPCGNGLPRINFYKEILRYTIGRDAGRNYITLAGWKVSASHCVLTWDPKASMVNVLDMSSNGTWLDSEKVGKGETKPLKDAAEICFGTTIPQPKNGGIEDFRYVFHYTADGPPTEGIKAYFNIGVQLGKGSFGSVHEATHKSTGLKFAVKMIVKGAFGIPKRTVSQIQESEIGTMTKLEHPNICKLIQVFDSAERISLVLEYVDGGDLLQLMENRFPNGIPEITAKDLVYQACDALAFIHSKGIIHQDLKPENILLTKDRHPIVKIADFGCSRAVDCVTMLRTQCGTPYYLAPEMAGLYVTEKYAHMVDSWSMGVIAFSMLTGKCPFVDDPLQADHDAIRDWTIDWLTFVNQPALYPESLAFIRDLLQKDPEKRMALCDSFDHPWLKDHTPFHRNIATVFRPTDMNSPRTVSMASKIAHEKSVPSNTAVEMDTGTITRPITRSDSSEVFDLLLRGRSQESIGYHGSVGTVGSAGGARGGRGLGVRRRSEVIAEAAETGNALPQPSEAMIAYTTSRRGSRVPRATGGANQSLCSGLGVIVEEAPDEEDEDMDVKMASPAKVMHNKVQKFRPRMKENDDDMDIQRTVRPPALATRRKGKGVVSRTVRGPGPFTRRSSRLKGGKGGRLA